MMEVRLISFTQNPEYVCYLASRTCRSPVGPIEMLSQVQTPEIIRAHIRARLEDGHLSIFEHASFTLGIEGISRNCSHQFVRHRAGCSYSQQSQRHTEPARYIFPDNLQHRTIYAKALIRASETYHMLLNSGIPKEDARFVLPQASSTNLVVTMNARSLMHFFDLRISEHAQWEIRKLAKLMLSEVIKKAPTIFEGYKECLIDVPIGK